MISAKKLLLNAAVRLSDERNHTKSYLAEKPLPDYPTAKTPALPTDPDATCWCLMGAVAAEAGDVAKTPRDLFGRRWEETYDDDGEYLGEAFTIGNDDSAPTGEFAKALDYLDDAAVEVLGDDAYEFVNDEHGKVFAFVVNDRMGYAKAMEVLQKAIELAAGDE